MLSSLLIPGSNGKPMDGPEGLEGRGYTSWLGHFLNTGQMHLLVFSRWNKWALSHGKRELQASSSYPMGLADEKTSPTQALDLLQDEQSTLSTPQAR